MDALEIHNGEAAFSFFGLLSWRANKKAQVYFDYVSQPRRYLEAIASSDGHFLQELGTSWTEITMPFDYPLSLTSPEDVVENLRMGIMENRLKCLRTQRRDSKFRAFTHATSLVGIIALSKIGIKL